MQVLVPLFEQYGLWLVFANVLALQLGVPVPAYPILIVVGAISKQGHFGLKNSNRSNGVRIESAMLNGSLLGAQLSGAAQGMQSPRAAFARRIVLSGATVSCSRCGFRIDNGSRTVR